MQGTPLVHACHHLVIRAVESVHPDHAGLLLHVGIVRVGGIQVVLKDSQPIQVFNLEGNRTTVMYG